MKKLGLFVREIFENKIKTSLKESESVFIIKYSKLSSPDLTSLRQSLKGYNARLFVIKNSITRRAIKGSTLEPLMKYIEGPCGLVFAKDEPAGVGKILYDFSKDHENLKIEGGFLREKILEPKDIQALAKLPGKDALRAQLVYTMKSPITGIVVTLNRVLGKLVICLEQIKKKKSG